MFLHEIENADTQQRKEDIQQFLRLLEDGKVDEMGFMVDKRLDKRFQERGQ